MAAFQQRNSASGYWGKQLGRRSVGNGVVQLHEASAPPEAVIAHGHGHAHIVFVTRGAYVTSVTGENSFVASPVAVLNPPEIWHRDHFVGGRGSFMTVDLEMDSIAPDKACHKSSAHVLQHCHRLSQALNDGLAVEIEDALDKLSRLFTEKMPSEFAGIPASVERVFDAVAQANEPWSLTMADLAAIADIHPNHLPRAFGRRFGYSASQLVARRQLELCGEALATSDEPLADIAVRYGFYDQAHMNRRFRQLAMVTPDAWRKISRRG